MTKTEQKPWYVADRGELLAQVFLQDLKPVSVARGGKDGGVDYLATFKTPNQGLRVIAVEVKATERPVKDNYSLKADLVSRLSTANVPVLILVVNVKSNEIYYTWARGAAALSSQNAGKRTWRVPVKRADEHKEELLQEILSE